MSDSLTAVPVVASGDALAPVAASPCALPVRGSPCMSPVRGSPAARFADDASDDENLNANAKVATAPGVVLSSPHAAARPARKLVRLCKHSLTKSGCTHSDCKFAHPANALTAIVEFERKAQMSKDMGQQPSYSVCATFLSKGVRCEVDGCRFLHVRPARRQKVVRCDVLTWVAAAACAAAVCVVAAVAGGCIIVV
jgi:hypothetical protein